MEIVLMVECLWCYLFDHHFSDAFQHIVHNEIQFKVLDWFSTVHVKYVTKFFAGWKVGRMLWLR